MSDRYSKPIRTLNDLLRSELGANPRYSWRWSEDLWHVMEIYDPETGLPKLQPTANSEGLIVMGPVTAKRKLLPFHSNCWVVCALVEVNERDGSITGTGNHAWIPLSSGRSGPVCLDEHEEPSLEVTQSIIATVRQERSKSATEMGAIWTEEQARAEKARWTRVYDRIRDAATAYHSVPGKKAHVSFGGLIQ